jgi:hypothetical protein
MNNSTKSNTDSLEEACWNGLLPELLPEIIKTSTSDNHLTPRRISQGNTLLHIELAMEPVEFEGAFSIKPEFIIAAKNFN